MKPVIDYGESFCEKLEPVKYKAAVAMEGATGAMKGASRDEIDQELGLESLKSRRWYKLLSCVFKIMKKEAPNYLINFIPKCEVAIRTRNNNFMTYNSRTD